MKSFLASLNSTRVIILASFLGSLVLGGLVYAQKQRLAELEFEVGPRGAPRLVQEIQGRALELANLQRVADREQFREKDNAETYIRNTAANQYVNIGEVDIDPSQNQRVQGVIDNVFTIRPPRGNARAFTRDQISNFIYKLEADSRRVRVTRVVIRPQGTSRPKPHEVAPDAWTFEVDITIRRPRE